MYSAGTRLRLRSPSLGAKAALSDGVPPIRQTSEDAPMLGIVFACVAPLVLVVYWRSLPEAWRDQRALLLILAGYAIRLLLSSIVREFPFFSYGSGGDSEGYEYGGIIIARMWDFSGVHLLSPGELDLGPTKLPLYLFATVAYLNDGPTHIGCVAVVAAIGCATALNIYAIGREIGCRDKVALRMLAAITFLPTFVFFTADTHKDGLVAFFMFGVFGSAIRLARRFTPVHLVVGLASLAGLWWTRYYLVFIMWIPLTIGLFGVRSKSFVRIAIVGLGIAVGAILSMSHSTVLSSASDTAADAYANGTGEDIVAYNVQVAGSGVEITGTGPGAFAQKFVYSLFAPFPWQSGSIGMQLSKFEMLIWYYIAYRCVPAIRLMLVKRRSDLLLFTLFIVPTMVAYTMGFANVGLALRERMNIVLAIMLLASFSWGLADEDAQGEVVSSGAFVPWRGARSPSRQA